jgi:peptide/nickel transport system substrate-binding protein
VRTIRSACRWITAPAVAVVALTAIAHAADQPVTGGTISVGLGGDPATLNPALSSGISEAMVGCAIYEGLVQPTATYQFRPALAKAWTVSDDGLTYTFDLQHTAWQDGQPFTAADVAYSLTEFNARYSPMFAAPGKLIDHIETPAPDKVVIHLKQPSATFLMSLSCIQGGAIMPQHLFKGTDARANPANSTAPVGTGPFRLTAWKHGDTLELARNPAYWDHPKPYLDRVIIKIMPQSASRLQALQAGDIDFIQGWNVAPSDEAVVRADKDLKLETTGYAPAAVVVEFNTTRPPLADVRARQALFIATDRNYLLRTTWFGDGTVSVQPFNNSITWAANLDIDFTRLYPFDPAAANKLLDQAGFPRKPDGTRFTLHVVVTSDAPERTQAALALKSMWRAIGVDVQPASLERVVFANQVYTAHDFDVTIEGLNTFGDPALGITRMYATNAIGRAYGNASRYSNPEVDQLFLTAEQKVDQTARGVLYKQAEAILARDVPTMPVRDYRMTDAVSAGVHGLWGALGPADWANAWMDPR